MTTAFLWVSQDAGKTFSVPRIDESQLANRQILTQSGFAFAPSDQICLAGGAGIFESTHRGQTWTLLLGSPANAQTVAVGHQDPGVVYASNWHGTYVSDDYGLHWSQASTEPFHVPAVDPLNSKVLVGTVPAQHRSRHLRHDNSRQGSCQS